MPGFPCMCILRIGIAENQTLTSSQDLMILTPEVVPTNS